MKRILVVEDDPDIQEMLCAYLRDAGYETGTAGDGLAALDRFHSGVWNLILLDIMLPKVDGYGVCELIRRESSVPVIMLTALDAEENQLKGFDLDVDDYVTKPFSMPVLLRKIAAVLRRAGNGEVENSLLLYQDLILDLDAYRVTEGGQPVDLTSREFELLRELLQNQGRVSVSYTHLLTTEHQASLRLHCPLRRDFTSVPHNSMPASKLSSTK